MMCRVTRLLSLRLTSRFHLDALDGLGGFKYIYKIGIYLCLRVLNLRTYATGHEYVLLIVLLRIIRIAVYEVQNIQTVFLLKNQRLNIDHNDTICRVSKGKRPSSTDSIV
jgi:hypothetical protein